MKTRYKGSAQQEKKDPLASLPVANMPQVFPQNAQYEDACYEYRPGFQYVHCTTISIHYWSTESKLTNQHRMYLFLIFSL